MKKCGWMMPVAVLLITVLLQGCLSSCVTEAKSAATNERRAKSLKGTCTSGETKIGDYTWLYTTRLDSRQMEGPADRLL